MKLKKHANQLKMPPIGLLELAYLQIDEIVAVALILVSVDTLNNMREKRTDVDGRPVYFAYDRDGWLQLFPNADRDYEIKVRYYPPMVEI
jgi:hypothetical protein